MQRVRELDSIRGLAALAIVIYHLWLPTVGLLSLAVDMFFVLSGYLITTIILDNSLTEGFLFAFYVRRSLRIWPVCYLALAALVLINGFLPALGTLGDLPFYFTYTQEVAHSWMDLRANFSARVPPYMEPCDRGAILHLLACDDLDRGPTRTSRTGHSDCLHSRGSTSLGS